MVRSAVRWAALATRLLTAGAILGTLAACGLPLSPYPSPSSTPYPAPSPAPSSDASKAGAQHSSPPAGLPWGASDEIAPDPGWPALLARADAAPLPAAIRQAKSVWQPVRWAEVPGVSQDALHEAWNAWLRSCERAVAPWLALCPEIRQLSIATHAERRAWLLTRLQPYRIEPLQPEGEGLLTAYYEPQLPASRLQRPGFDVPVYRSPSTLAQRKPWYTRQEIDTLPEARAALQGRAIAWLADPVDALMLQIQGSGRLLVSEPDGTQRLTRVAFAATNDQPYRSVGRWLLDQGALRDASWPGIRAWIAQNPQRQQEMLWSNPRVVFFREEALSDFDAGFGPRGAQGVALTPGRSVAIDRDSVPYGTPLWLVSQGSSAKLQRLVMAQDTGSAIVGALRADLFAGWGFEAGDWAGRFKQPVQLWALWPRNP